mgnify:CR=1 FL=1
MKKMVLSLVTSLAIGSVSLSAADIYATVNGEEVTPADVALVLRNPKIEFDTLPKETKDRVIERAIEKKLLTTKALSSGIEKTDTFKEAINKIKKDLALEIWMQEEFKKLKVTEADKKAYYKNNELRFKRQATLEARHILVETEETAKGIIKDLDSSKDKKAKFIELAKSKSTGPTGEKGGYLGKFAPSQMVPEFSSAAGALEVGSYTKIPVKTQFGFHVILLEGKNDAQTAKFSEVEKQITQAVLQEEFAKNIKSIATQLREKAKIVIK